MHTYILQKTRHEVGHPLSAIRRLGRVTEERPQPFPRLSPAPGRDVGVWRRIFPRLVLTLGLSDTPRPGPSPARLGRASETDKVPTLAAYLRHSALRLSGSHVPRTTTPSTMNSPTEQVNPLADGPAPPSSFPGATKRPGPRGAAAYPRKRAVTACQVCRARRTKCDNLKPSCSFCLKVGAMCVQTAADLSSYDPASLQILARLGDLEQLIRGIGTSQNPGQTATEERPAPNRESFDRSRLNPCSIDRIMEWDALVTLRGPRMPNEHAYPCTDSEAMRTLTTTPTSGYDELEPQHTKLLLDNFFNYVHVKNPVLDEKRTRQTVSRVCMHGIDWSPEACLALLVCALGTIATPFLGCHHISRDSDAYRVANSLFLAAKKRLGMLLGTSSLIEAQCMFLSGVYSMCTFQRLPAWRFFMQSLACCQTFESLKAFRQNYGEQLDEDGRDSATAEQAIYWSAWKSEREIHQDLGLPGYLFSEIDISGYPPFFPTPPRHEEEPLGPVASETERREQASWYFYLSEISLLRLRRRIGNEIKNIEPENGNDPLPDLAKLVVQHEQQILDWVDTLPEIMSIHARPEEDDICRFVLRGHLINVYEMLYWPFVEWAINGPWLHADTPSLVELVVKGLSRHVQRIIVNRPGFRHRHHGTFCMIVSCTRSALVLLAAAHACATSKSTILQSHHLPIGWEDAVQDVIRLNESWEHDAPDLGRMVLILNDLWARWTQLPGI